MSSFQNTKYYYPTFAWISVTSRIHSLFKKHIYCTNASEQNTKDTGKLLCVLPSLPDCHSKCNVWKFLVALYIFNWIKCISKKSVQPAQMTCWSGKVEDWTRSGTELSHLPLNNLISLSVQTTLDYKVKAEWGIFRSISTSSPKIESVILCATNWKISFSN